MTTRHDCAKGAWKLYKRGGGLSSADCRIMVQTTAGSGGRRRRRRGSSPEFRRGREHTRGRTATPSGARAAEGVAASSLEAASGGQGFVPVRIDPAGSGPKPRTIALELLRRSRRSPTCSPTHAAPPRLPTIGRCIRHPAGGRLRRLQGLTWDQGGAILVALCLSAFATHLRKGVQIRQLAARPEVIERIGAICAIAAEIRGQGNGRSEPLEARQLRSRTLKTRLTDVVGPLSSQYR
jgi:hypothetical protein